MMDPMTEAVEKASIHKVIRETYDLRNSDTEKVVKKIISFIENECLKWNHISCEWELK